VRIADSLQALTAYGASDIGRVRTINEDTFICDGDRGIFAVIDGVGGHAGGEVAASIARRELDLRLRRETGTVEDRIREAIAAANASILAEADRVPALTQMACVLTVAVVTPGNLVIGHVGDTRLYKLGPAGLHKLTHDHSPVGQLEDRGHLREEEAMHHPERNQVYREVGTQPRQPTDAEFIEVITSPFAADEAILLCSDGLSDQVTSADIEAIVRQAVDPSAAVTALLGAANAAGGRDNTTVILAARPLFGERGAWQAAGRRNDTSELISSGDARRSTRETNDGQPLAAAADRLRPSYGRAPLYATAVAVLAAAILWPTETLSPAETTATSPSAPRVLLVSSAPGAGYTSIGAALAAAQAGDVIDVAAGTYREPVVLKEGVSIRARERRASILQPPDGTGHPWTAISATSIRSGDISGFMVKGTDTAPLEYGVRVSDASVELDDLDIAGARAAAVYVAGHSAVRLRSSHIHDNAGVGIVVDSGAVPEILHNVITGNGRLVPPRPGIELRPGARGTIVGNIVKGNGQSIAGASPAELARLGAENAIEATPPAARRRGAP
jgi:serine/threonine protein phosphatase PrpC